MVVVVSLQDTKLGVQSSLKEFTDYATIKHDRPLGGGGGLVTLVHHSVTFRVPDGGILPNDATAGVLAVEAKLGGTTLNLNNVYAPRVVLPRNFSPYSDALLEDHGDHMVLGDFNTHLPSWFSRKGDDRAAPRREALDETINSS